MFALIHQNYKIISLYKNDQKEIRNLKTNEVKSKLKNVYNFINNFLFYYSNFFL